MDKKSKDHPCACSCIYSDWFYLVLIVLIGLILLCINLGLLSSDWIAYWPALLVIIGVKEIVERN